MDLNFTVQKREAGKPQTIREQGIIPGIFYGPGIKPVSIAMDYNSFDKLYEKAGESSLIDLKVEGMAKPTKVLIQDIQYDPVKGRVIHVDFRGVKMDQEMTVEIELNFIGEALAVKELSGTLMKANNSVNVKCLPNNLVSQIEVDLGALKTFDDVIHAGDLQMPAGIKLVDDAGMLIAKVTPPLTEEQLKAMEEAEVPSVGEVEVEEKGKKEEEGEKEEGEEEKKEEGENPAAEGEKEAKKE